MTALAMARPPTSGARAPRRWGALLALLLALLLAGCGKQAVYGHLTEVAANEMVAVLGEAGITAGKVAGDKDTWSVEVDSGDFARAVDTLRAHGLPHDDFDTLGTVFRNDKFTSTPLEERARLQYALEQQLSRTISDIDGVVKARVHLTMPEADPLSREAKPSAAAVFVKYRPGFDLRAQTGAVRSLVTNAIDGLTYERVSVIMVPAQTMPVAATPVGEGLGTTARVLLALVAAGLLGFAGHAVWRGRRRRSALPVKAER